MKSGEVEEDSEMWERRCGAAATKAGGLGWRGQLAWAAGSAAPSTQPGPAEVCESSRWKHLKASCEGQAS